MIELDRKMRELLFEVDWMGPHYVFSMLDSFDPNEWCPQLVWAVFMRSSQKSRVLKYLFDKGILKQIWTPHEKVVQVVKMVQEMPPEPVSFTLPRDVRSLLVQEEPNAFAYIPHSGMVTREMVRLWMLHCQIYPRRDQDWDSKVCLGYYDDQLKASLKSQGSRMTQDQLVRIVKEPLEYSERSSVFIWLERKFWPIWMWRTYWKQFSDYEMVKELPDVWTPDLAKAFFEVTQIIQLIPREYREDWMSDVLVEDNQKKSLKQMTYAEVEPPFHRRSYSDYPEKNWNWTYLKCLSLLENLLNELIPLMMPPYLWAPSLLKPLQHRRKKLHWRVRTPFEQDC
jgi:hypothetical protein